MSKNMCSLSGIKKDNQEPGRHIVGKQNNNVTKREICPTMGRDAGKKKALVVLILNEATSKLMTTMQMFIETQHSFNPNILPR